jgi:hypothetical protein
VVPISLSREQSALVDRPIKGKLFLEGQPGSGKTTTGVARLMRMITEGVPAESILLLVPQRSLAFPYYELLRRPDLPAGGLVSVVTITGLARRMVELFWPLVARNCGFGHPDQPPMYLTLETAQYYLARLVRPLIEQGYFETVAIDRNRLYSQILDNLNKSAVVGFDYRTFGERLKAAWQGDPTQLHVYDEAQDCANRFRQYCLDNNLLDFSLLFELFANHLWPSLLCREFLTKTYRHLIYDNIEEDVPVAHDIIRQWLPQFESSLLIYDQDGGYRLFLGADPESGYSLREECDETVQFAYAWLETPELADLRRSLTGRILRQAPDPNPPRFRSVFSLSTHRFFPEMIDWVSQSVIDLVANQAVPPGEIVVVSPFLSDSLRFSLMNQLEGAGIPVQSYRASRSLREEAATRSLLTFARLAHPAWGMPLTQNDLRYALMQSISSLDLVRADLLARITYRPNHPEEGLNSFDKIRPEMQDRITYVVGEKYELLRNWLAEYQAGGPLELDIFLSRLFGEVLSQPGFGFHENFDPAAVTARLIESIQKFRWAFGDPPEKGSATLGREYIQMVEDGVLAAQYLQGWENLHDNAVLIAPAYTFLMANRGARYQFWLDVGSLGWYERLAQPLTHPYVLSRSWPGNSPWTDADEVQANSDAMARLVGGLIRRCSERVSLCTVGVNERGDEQRGPLLQALQFLLRKLNAEGETGHV